MRISQTEKIGDMGPRPPKSRANAAGQTPMNILALGSQPRDGQGAGFGNSSKLGTDISDTRERQHAECARHELQHLWGQRLRLRHAHLHSALSNRKSWCFTNGGGGVMDFPDASQIVHIRRS